MRWWTRVTCLAVSGLLWIAASGCGDNAANSFTCHYVCPANEEVSGTKNYSAADASAAASLCESDTSIACSDTVCTCTPAGAQ